MPIGGLSAGRLHDDGWFRIEVLERRMAFVIASIDDADRYASGTRAKILLPCNETPAVAARGIATDRAPYRYRPRYRGLTIQRIAIRVIENAQCETLLVFGFELALRCPCIQARRQRDPRQAGC